jgi:hypothetical protein
MRSSKWLLLAIFVLISSLFLWACGGGNNEDSGAAPTAQPTARGAAETPESGETPEAVESPEAVETPEAQQDGGQFGDLARAFGDAEFKATYQLSGTDPSGAFEGTMVWYKKGDNLRIDFESEVEGEQISATIISGPDQSYLCTEIPGMGEGGSCFASSDSTGEGPEAIVSDLESALTDPSVEVVSTSSRQIAGEDADCFTIRSPEFQGDAEFCLSQDGVPLYGKGTDPDGTESSLEATDFSHDVSDSDFEPPYPVIEGIPGME